MYFVLVRTQDCMGGVGYTIEDGPYDSDYEADRRARCLAETDTREYYVTEVNSMFKTVAEPIVHEFDMDGNRLT